MMSKLRLVSILALSAMGALAVACGDDGEQPTGSHSTGASDPTGGSGPGGSTTESTTTGDSPIASVKVEPESATLVVENGEAPAATQFKLIGVHEDGTETPLDADWELSTDFLKVNTDGAVTATGKLGGKAILTATHDGMSAMADVTVRLVFVETESGTSDETKQALDDATEAPDPAVVPLYPYDKTLFPRGLAAPVIQWSSTGEVNDTYRIHVESEFVELTAYTTAPLNRYSFSANADSRTGDLFGLFADSTDGDITVELTRTNGSVTFKTAPQTWTIAPVDLEGTIYYENTNNGFTERLQVGAAEPKTALVPPAGVTCIGCHSVSASGNRLIASLHGGYSPWATFDTKTGNALYSPDIGSAFQAISPNGDFVVWGEGDETGVLKASKFDNATVLAQLTVPGGKPARPEWSPDGKKIAFVRRSDGNYLDFNNSDLWITDFDSNLVAFSNTHQLAASDAVSPVAIFPTFSPDSKWVVYERANQARTRGAAGELWITNLDGTVSVPLRQTNGTFYLPPGEQTMTYEPVMYPVQVGDYWWVAFQAERRYGNTIMGDPVSRQKQVYIAAIDASPKAGEDPSHPAFRLPGQRTSDNSVRIAWAPTPP